MCRSPAVRAPGDGERRLLHPANWKYRPRPGIRTSPKPPLSTGVFCEFRCHEAAVRDLTTPATTGRWRFAQNFSGWPPLDDRFTAANLDPALAQPGHNQPVRLSWAKSATDWLQPVGSEWSNDGSRQ